MVEKIVKDALLSTLAAASGLFVLMILVLSLFFPSSMMGITYSLGMEQCSIAYAKAAYRMTKNVYYIAEAVDTAIEIDHEKNIISCGEKFIKDKNFEEYCEQQEQTKIEGVETSYKTSIYANVCVALYETGKKDEAINRAFAYTGNSFSKGNAIFAVAIFSLKEKDTQSTQKIIEKMQQMQVEDFSESDKAYYDAMLAFIIRENG